MFKKSIFTAVIGFMLLTTPSFAAGIPVYDAANFSQEATNFAQEIQNMIKQLTTAQDQLQQQLTQYQALTGDRGMAQLLDGTIRNYLPDDWQDAMSLLDKPNGYSDLTNRITETLEKHFEPIDENLSQSTQELLQKDRELTAKGSALFDAAYDQAQERVNAINQLTQNISAATDPKAIMDLQARIQAELAHLQIEQNKAIAMVAAIEQEKAIEDQKMTEIYIKGGGSPKNYKY